jgi:hypothetical protein
MLVINKVGLFIFLFSNLIYLILSWKTVKVCLKLFFFIHSNLARFKDNLWKILNILNLIPNYWIFNLILYLNFIYIFNCLNVSILIKIIDILMICHIISILNFLFCKFINFFCMTLLIYLRSNNFIEKKLLIIVISWILLSSEVGWIDFIFRILFLNIINSLIGLFIDYYAIINCIALFNVVSFFEARN